MYLIEKKEAFYRNFSGVDIKFIDKALNIK
jgi:hypothetical protein